MTKTKAVPGSFENKEGLKETESVTGMTPTMTPQDSLKLIEEQKKAIANLKDELLKTNAVLNELYRKNANNGVNRIGVDNYSEALAVSGLPPDLQEALKAKVLKTAG